MLRRFCLLALPLALLAGGCGGGSEAADLDTSRPAEFGYQTSPKTVRLQEGKAAYESYCIGCHGATGDGNGDAARFMNPRPRNFQKAKFKFISTRFGELPTDEDLFRTITNGLRGTSMPAWGHLPEETRWALVDYIKTFSEDWAYGPFAEIPVVTDPYASSEDKTEAIARGEVAYHGFFTCWNCHPAYVPEDKINEYMVSMGGNARAAFRPNLHEPALKLDSEGETIFAPDFLRDYIKSGTTVEDLYRTIGAGITGTAMPTWIDSVAEEYAPRDKEGNLLVSRADIWAIAYYVQDLVKKREIKFEPGKVEVRLDRKIEYTPDGAKYVATVEEAGEPAAAEPDDAEEFFEEDVEYFDEE